MPNIDCSMPRRQLTVTHIYSHYRFGLLNQNYTEKQPSSPKSSPLSSTSLSSSSLSLVGKPTPCGAWRCAGYQRGQDGRVLQSEAFAVHTEIGGEGDEHAVAAAVDVSHLLGTNFGQHWMIH